MAVKGGYQERDSPFFRLKSKTKLATFLFIGSQKLKDLSDGRDLYRSFQKLKGNGKTREINAPRDDLKKVQRRIADLLQRIQPPDYLFAPVNGRSYVDNAAVHVGANAVHLLDIEDFFPSCTANKVIWFFKTRMECSADVSVILKNIVTRKGCLPQGSPCSPILAYLCYADMWNEIEEAVRRHHCQISVYADDLTISGKVVPQQLVWEIKATLRKHGHVISAHKERSRFKRPVEITGVVVTNGRMSVPNRQLKRIVETRDKLANEKKPKAVEKLQNELKGRISQVTQIKNHPRQPAHY